MATDAARMMTELRWRAPDPPRLLFLAVILLAHAVAIYVMGWRTRAPPIAQEEEIVAVPITLTPIVEPARVEPRSTPTRPVPKPRPKQEARAPLAPPAPLPANAVTPPIAAPVPVEESPRPNWADEAKEAAQRYAQAHPLAQSAPSGKAPVGIFDKESPHRAGDVQILGPGVERRWISANCYREFGHMPQPYTGRTVNIIPITCLGPSKPRDDLFEELKPDYLKKAPK